MAQPPWHNSDGLEVKFGNYYRDSGNFVNRARALRTAGAFKQIAYDFDLTKLATTVVAYTSDLDNDGTSDGFNTGDIYLPANSTVTSVWVISTETAVGGTSFVFGTYALTGAAISANSLVTATEAVTANLAIGMKNQGAGALNATAAGTAGVGSVDAYLAIKPTGTFTAGKGTIIVTYIDATSDVA